VVLWNVPHLERRFPDAPGSGLSHGPFMAFEHTGAELTTTNTLKHAFLLVEHDGLSAAILDHALGGDNSSLLYERLKRRGILS
jgi:hypothetical protein